MPYSVGKSPIIIKPQTDYDLALDPMPLYDVTIREAEPGEPAAIEYFDGYLWGVRGSTIYRSSDDGVTWEEVATAEGTGAIVRLIPTADGEVLVGRTAGIWKSSGWPSPSGWKQTLDVAGGTTAHLRAWGFDGDGTKFIATHYTGVRGDSRYVWISTDAGETFRVVWDVVAEFPDSHEESHLHAACYDPWEDRFLFTNSHGEAGGLYESRDDGATWTRLEDTLGVASSAPTVIVATDKGLVFGSDHPKGGVYVWRRGDNQMRWAWRWHTVRHGVVGFADRGFRDPNTGIVYMGWRTDFDDVPLIITASDGVVANLVWQSDPGEFVALDRVSSVVVSRDRLIGVITSESTGISRRLFARLGGRGVQPVVDSGRVLGGEAERADSTAVGTGSSASGLRSVAVGVQSSAPSENGIAIGAGSSAGGVHAVAVGRNTLAGPSSVGVGTHVKAGEGSFGATAVGYQAEAGSASVALGFEAKARNNGVAIGRGAAFQNSAHGDYVIIGRSASAGTTGTAVGSQSYASNSADAFGYQARAAHTQSVALGRNTETTARDQVALGARHVEMLEVDTPDTPGEGAARLALRNNNGVQELVVVFANGTVKVLADDVPGEPEEPDEE